MSDHAPTPWTLPKAIDEMVRDANGNPVLVDLMSADGYANLRRIMACVNALAGMSTEILEKLIHMSTTGEPLNHHIYNTERQRDELQAALDRVRVELLAIDAMKPKTLDGVKGCFNMAMAGARDALKIITGLRDQKINGCGIFFSYETENESLIEINCGSDYDGKICLCDKCKLEGK